MSVSAEARAIADAQLVAYNAYDMDSYLALFLSLIHISEPTRPY